jgi:hypothetical protein
MFSHYRSPNAATTQIEQEARYQPSRKSLKAALKQPIRMTATSRSRRSSHGGVGRTPQIPVYA